jgi:threonine synthase
MKYISTRGKTDPVLFDEALLQGFAPDGGLYVPQTIPQVTVHQLEAYKGLTYQELALRILPLFIDSSVIPFDDLNVLVNKSFDRFDHPQLMPIIPLNEKRNLYCMELFHGPTLSFKDIAMGFLINTMDYLLTKQDHHLSIVLATTGDTGPAAAFAAQHLSSIDCFPLYPAGMISKEQECQMTTLNAPNIHPVSVQHCANGGDDLDLVVANLFNSEKKDDMELSSVNSINLCRVMVQSIHYFYGYLNLCDKVGDPIDISVPSGAFGNLFAGFLARSMGLPVRKFICSTNDNATLHRLFSKGVFEKRDLIQTVSSAIDIVVPYNLWRFLFYTCGSDAQRLTAWMDEFEQKGFITLDKKTLSLIQDGFLSCSVSDDITLCTIKQYWDRENYLLDPHGAVAVAGAGLVSDDASVKTLCLATAHPAKFPEIIRQALSIYGRLPKAATHPSLTQAMNLEESFTSCSLAGLEEQLTMTLLKQSKKG